MTARSTHLPWLPGSPPRPRGAYRCDGPPGDLDGFFAHAGGLIHDIVPPAAHWTTGRSTARRLPSPRAAQLWPTGKEPARARSA